MKHRYLFIAFVQMMPLLLTACISSTGAVYNSNVDSHSTTVDDSYSATVDDSYRTTVDDSYRTTVDDSTEHVVDTAECSRLQGEVKNIGLLGTPTCVIPFSDSGAICSRHEDCLGKCLLYEQSIDAGTRVQGVCQHSEPATGCIAEVENGVAGPAICID